MPGSIDQWPNWRIALPMPVEPLLDTALAEQVAPVMAAGGPRTVRR